MVFIFNQKFKYNKTSQDGKVVLFEVGLQLIQVTFDESFLFDEEGHKQHFKVISV